MNGEGDYTPAELIDVFLDGEADAVQRTVLFTAMANDSALQEEFQEAMLIRAAALKDAQNLAPPPALTQRLFAAAGFAAPLGKRPAARRGAARKAGMGIGGMNGLMTPLVAAAAASAITGAAMYAVFHSNNGSVHHRQVPAIRQEAAPAQVSEMPEHSSASALSSGGIGAARAYARIRRYREPSVFVVDNGAFGSLPAATTETVEHPVAANSDNVQRFAQPAPLLTAVESRAASIVDRAEMPIAPQNSPALNDPPRWAFVLRGLTALDFYPSRAWESTWNIPTNNFSLGVMYRISDNHSVGAEAGREMFPLYTQHSDGGFRLESSIEWAGAAYRFTADPITSVGGVSPFVQVTLGGANLGPLGKTIAGVEWQPASRFMFVAAGVEGTLLVGKSYSWYAIGKLGVDYSIGFYF